LLIFLSGCLIALPVLSFHSPALAGDSDSGRLLATILYVQRHGFDHLVQTQEVLLPHALLGPIVTVGGITALEWFNVLSVIALTGVVAFLAWRLTGSSVAALAAALALIALGAILERAYRVPMYPTMLALGFLGVYLVYRAMTTRERARRWLTALLAAVCLVAAIEAHQVGQLFVVLSALLLVAVPGRAALAGLGRVYLFLAVLYIPRVVINVADGGLSHFFDNRIDYWVTKGYLLSIQVEFFGYPREWSLGEYLRELPNGIYFAWGPTGVLTLALGAASVLFVPTRLRRFIVATTLLLLLVIVHYRLPFFSRYFSPLLVGSAIGAGVTVAALVRRGTLRSQAVAALAVLGLVVANAFSYHTQLNRLQTFKGASNSYRQLAQEVTPGGGVVGTRSFKINNSSTGARVYGGDFLTESEYVTFLTWPSDAEVIELMRRHDAKWVLVPKNPDRWVVRYNDVWLQPAYGKEARYPFEVRKSPSFCLVRRVNGVALYRLDPGGPRTPIAGGVQLCAR
jgi:hypothetical protein